jgi:hypothetical protein
MSRQATKDELVNILAGSNKSGKHIIILSYNSCYKSHDYNNLNRHSIDSLSEVEVKKLLAEQPQSWIILFQSQRKPKPAWMNKDRCLLIPVNSEQKKLLKDFFNCEFTPMDFKSKAEYYKYHMPQREDELWYLVSHLWSDYAEAEIARIEKEKSLTSDDKINKRINERFTQKQT